MPTTYDTYTSLLPVTNSATMPDVWFGLTRVYSVYPSDPTSLARLVTTTWVNGTLPLGVTRTVSGPRPRTITMQTNGQLWPRTRLSC